MAESLIGAKYRKRRNRKGDIYEVTSVFGPDIYYISINNPLKGLMRLQESDFHRIMEPVTSLERFLDGCED